MPGWLAALPIERLQVLVPVYVAAAVLVAGLLLPVLGVRGPRRLRLGLIALLAGIGAAAGWSLVWWFVDVQDVFGAPASDVIRAAATGAGAGTGIALGNLVRTAWWRKAVAIVAVPAVLAAGGLLINRDVAYFPRFGDVVGVTGVSSLKLEAGATADRSLKHWSPPADMPKKGVVSTASIPGEVSRFRARDAWVYLPPAARVANPPKLPVVIAFSGEPGGPSDVFLAGNMQQSLDSLAAAHEGIAPIVVVPDQLGGYSKNPMCTDSRLGNVRTYVTVDVRDWILDHLPVATGRRAWTVAGFSEGATCAVQFATASPALFGSFIAVSPEVAPFNHSLQYTIAKGWDGSRKAYERDTPLAVMRRTKRYSATAAVYTVGADDRRYGKDAGILAAESRKVHMHVSYRVLPDLAHNWNTGAAGLEYGLQTLAGWWRLP